MSVALGVSRPLLVRTVAVPDPGDLVARLPKSAPYVWIRRGEGLAAWGEAASVAVPPGPGRFAWARRWAASLFREANIDDDVRVPGSGPVAFGSFTFDGRAPGSMMVVPQVVLARRGGRAWLTTIGEVTPRPVTPRVTPGAIRYGDGSLTAAEWKQILKMGAK